MNSPKSPLIQKAILAVLTSILVCLVMIVQNQRREPSVNPKADRVLESPAQLESELTELPRPAVNAQPAMQIVPAPRTVSNDPRSSEPLHAVNSLTKEPARSTPASYSTLVNPAGNLTSGPAADGAANSDERITIAGRVMLRGVPPPERQIVMDATCGGLHPEPAFTRHYVVGEEGGLANVLVYVKGGQTRPWRTVATPVLENVRCMFEPYVLGLVVHQQLRILNSDPVLHNVHFTPKLNRELNLALPSKGQATTVKFDASELFVRVKCDVHPWMFAYVGVLEHPYFAVTDTNGMFALPPGLASGTYLLAAVHLRAGEIVKKVEVGPAVSEVNFVFQVPGH